MMAVPGTPQRIVGLLTMFFFNVLATLTWHISGIGVAFVVLVQLTGVALGVLFMIWGGEFENNNN